MPPKANARSQRRAAQAHIPAVVRHFIETFRMKQKIKKWTLRLTVTGLFIAGLLLIIILNPILTYANKTTHKTFTIYHNTKLDPLLTSQLDNANDLLKTSEFYNDKLNLDICLNNGSKYTRLIEIIGGRQFARGFYDKVVLFGNANFKENYVELQGYKWNLTQLLAHEMTHCLQFAKFGFWKSKPIANIDNWKWEGYAEYIARQNTNQKDLIKNLDRLNQSDKNSWEITFDDSTIASREYFNYWTMVQYCMDIKKMNYKQLLADTTKEQDLKQEMEKWYEEKKANAQHRFCNSGADGSN